MRPILLEPSSENQRSHALPLPEHPPAGPAIGPGKLFAVGTGNSEIDCARTEPTERGRNSAASTAAPMLSDHDPHSTDRGRGTQRPFRPAEFSILHLLFHLAPSRD